MKQAHLVSSLFIILLASAISFANVEDESLFFFDISKPLVCELEFGKSVSKVILEDFIDAETRSLQVIGKSGEIQKLIPVACEFNESFYSCRWSQGKSLKLNMFDVKYVSMSRKKRAYISGTVALDVFRPPSGVTCHLESLSSFINE